MTVRVGAESMGDLFGRLHRLCWPLLLGLLLFSPAQALDWPRWFDREQIPAVALSELPPEAQRTLQLIRQGGPFPYPRKDGVTFGNFEKRLPLKRRGYYREYTVPTPGVKHRGARRLIAGAGRDGDVATSGEYYYTDDHYRSFRRIRE